MYELISDLSSYPKFMRGCTKAEVLEEGDGWLIARLDLARGGIKQSFVTRNIMEPPNRIAIDLEDGPFKSLKGEWNFERAGESGCRVNFWLEFEFANRIVAFAAGKLFEKVASDQVTMVCQRAKAVYG